MDGETFIGAPCIWMGTNLLDQPVYEWGQIY
jgi:hypothetical protein